MSSEATPEVKIVGYCRACGKGLDEASVRTAHGTIYCAEHVPTDEPPAMPTSSAAGTSGTTYHAPDSPYATPGAAPGYGGAPYAASPYSGSPPPIPNNEVSPGLAFLFGLIPGVGAIYNGQYAKGLIHVFITGLMFTILSSDAGGFEALIVLLLIGFWAYMPFEAYHTASKRRRGLPVDEFSGFVQSEHLGRGPSRFPAAAVFLIVFGVIFLLNNLGIFEFRRIVRFWPALMIALGVYLLWLRMSGAQNGGGPGAGTGGGHA
jgi:TM2 domain-containing membrane protein YozV